MRVLKNAGNDVGINLQMGQYRLTAHVEVEQLWNEWEIQLLVLVSFAVQVFLLLFSGTRKRTTSGVLRGLLWLAYVLADFIAVFVLGHLALHINGPRHGLVLLWAPFMLLHLGGQETITAFSMEDNMLWKRHLLSLATQVGLAAYVVGKQWQGDKQLLAPMVLMFVSGTLKYAGRTSALMLVAKEITPGGVGMMAKSWSAKATDYSTNTWMMEEEQTYQELLWNAHAGLALCLAFLMDNTPLKARPANFSLQGLLSKEHRVHVSYKLAELQLRIVYDYCYTKIGANMGDKGNRLNGWFPKLVTLTSTFTALVLFSRADQKGLLNYSTADIIVSYLLLCGAIIMEMASIFIVISSVGKYFNVVQDEEFSSNHCCKKEGDIIFSIVRLVHPESRPQWSQKLPQYNLIRGCIKVKSGAGSGVLRRIMNVVGIKHDAWTNAEISHELKKFVLDKLLQVASRIHEDVWDISKFTGQWAMLELQNKRQERSSTLLKLFAKSIERPGFFSSVLTWHIVTDICFFLDDKLDSNDSPSSRTPSRELSNYVMYLCAEHGILSGNDGHILLKKFQEFILHSLRFYKESLDESAVVRYITDKVREIADEHRQPSELVAVEPVLILALQLAEELLMIKEASDRWGIIINVWMEMLCYMSFHCGPDFHIKHLSTGGEFITHVKVLIYNLGFPYSTYVPGNEEEPNHPGQVSTDMEHT